MDGGHRKTTLGRQCRRKGHEVVVGPIWSFVRLNCALLVDLRLKCSMNVLSMQT